MNAKLRAALTGFNHWHEVILASLIVGLLATAGYLRPDFLTLRAQAGLSMNVWEMALLALPMTLIVITGGIDLSIGSTMALSAVALGLSYEAGAPIAVCVALALVTGLTAGAINGLFVARVKVHPLIVTLATMSAFRGVAEGVSLARPVSGFPESLRNLSEGGFFGAPIPGVIFALAALVAAVMLARSTAGRSLYAIGHNELAARYSGIRVDRLKLWLYTLSGGCAGLAAVFFVARYNTAKADIGLGKELDVITAVVLGGTSIFGGRGTIPGTLLGILLIHETREFVRWHWNNDELILVVVGILLIASVVLHSLFSREHQHG